jgi:putative ABC transport system permease protein
VQIRVVGAFALLSLLLAGIGIYGLLSFAVSQRLPEFGLRMAIGATSNHILKIVMGRGIYVAAAGAISGMVLGYIAARSMESLLAGVQPADAMTFMAALAVAVVMTLLGSIVPAWRALRVDPARVMRNE